MCVGDEVGTTDFTHEDRDSANLREDARHTYSPRAGESDICRDVPCYAKMGLDPFI